MRRRDARERILDDDALLARRGERQRFEAEQVSLWIRFGPSRVFGGHDRLHDVAHAEELEPEEDFVSQRSGHDADRTRVRAAPDELGGAREGPEARLRALEIERALRFEQCGAFLFWEVLPPGGHN